MKLTAFSACVVVDAAYSTLSSGQVMIKLVKTHGSLRVNCSASQVYVSSFANLKLVKIFKLFLPPPSRSLTPLTLISDPTSILHLHAKDKLELCCQAQME